MEVWPEVTLGGSHEPYVDQVADEMPYITHPKNVAAYGTVDGFPWSLVLFKKQGDPEDEEPMAPEHQPKPARFEFFLGGSAGMPGSQPGGLGGGGGEISLRPGAHIDTTAHCWATEPPVIGYVIFTSDEVTTIRVSPENAEPRTFAAEYRIDGFPKFCVFFPPFAVAGEIAALSSDGTVLHRRQLYSGSFVRPGTFGGGD